MSFLRFLRDSLATRGFGPVSKFDVPQQLASTLQQFDYLGIYQTMEELTVVATVNSDELTAAGIQSVYETFRNLVSGLQLSTIYPRRGLLCFIFTRGCSSALLPLVQKQRHFSVRQVTTSWVIDVANKTVHTSRFGGRIGIWRMEPGRKYLERVLFDFARRDQRTTSTPRQLYPYRSRRVGLALRLLALPLLFVGAWVYDIAPEGLVGGRRPNPYSAGILALFCMPGMLLMYRGYQIGLPRGDQLLARDPRPPILYLRSFRDDRHYDLNPHDWPMWFFGIQIPPWMHLNGTIRLFANLWPLRILRLLSGKAYDTAEEQMAHYFRRLGPFVAIGRPGEKYLPGGAARLYIPEEDWHERVLDLICRAQVIVLQMGGTEGLRWEIEKLVDCRTPRRLLISLLNFRYDRHIDETRSWIAELLPRLRRRPLNSEDRYATVRDEYGRLCPKGLPEAIGDATFICFADDWTPRLLRLHKHSPLMYPFFAVAADLKKTLRPFFAPAGSDLMYTQKPRRHHGHGILAVCVYLALPMLAVFHSCAENSFQYPLKPALRTDRLKPRAWNQSDKSRVPTADKLRSAFENRVRHYGTDSMYTIDIPKAMKVTGKEGFDLFFRLPGQDGNSVAIIGIVASRTQIECQTELAERDSTSSAFTTQRWTAIIDGVKWLGVRGYWHGQSSFMLTHISLCHSGSSASFWLTLQYTTDEVPSELDEVFMEILGTFRIAPVEQPG